MAKKRGYQAEQRVPFKIALITFWQAIPSLLLIIIVIGGILKGVFTATEGSGIAVVYATILSFIGHLRLRIFQILFLNLLRLLVLLHL